jgi:hypothetical protein
MATSLKSRSRTSVLYLYGITAEGEGALPGVAGVDASAPVEAVPCAGLLCWASRVPKTEFADNLASNMENLEWLAEVSVRHQQVVAAIARQHDILPARFGTVFRTLASLQADVQQHKARMVGDLRRIRGCEEWGVKIFSERAASPSAAGAKSGRDYLQAKAAALRAQAPPAAGPEIEPLAQALQELAVAAAPGSGPVSRGQRGLLWQASLLLKRARRHRLQQVVERFSSQWAGKRRIELSGPWPPYSFVSRGQPAQAGGA